jgi:D-alanine-D-alanine ligase
MGFRYTGSGVMASALAMDKWRTKLVWIASGIPTPRYAVVDAGTDWMRVVAELGLPLIVKPAREGSTIGITKVTGVDHGELAQAHAVAAQHDDLVLVEEFVVGTELTASILNDRALPLIRIEAPAGNYDYHNKYFSDETKYFCPSGLAEAKEREIRAAALAAFRIVGCSGWGRLDLMLRPDGSFSFLEVNTSPGMTGHSLVPMAAKVAGLDFPSSASRSCEARMWDDARQMNAISGGARALRRGRAALGRPLVGACATLRSRSATSSSRRRPNGRAPRTSRRRFARSSRARSSR